MSVQVNRWRNQALWVVVIFSLLNKIDSYTYLLKITQFVVSHNFSPGCHFDDTARFLRDATPSQRIFPFFTCYRYTSDPDELITSPPSLAL